MPKSKAASVAALTNSTVPAETPEVNPSEPIVPNMPLLRVTLPTQLAFDVEMVVRNPPADSHLIIISRCSRNKTREPIYAVCPSPLLYES